jgi:hypothetical protein
MIRKSPSRKRRVRLGAESRSYGWLLALVPCLRLRNLKAPTSLGSRLGTRMAVLWIATLSCSYAWGPAAHRLVNGSAIQCLPSDMRGFFDANRQFVLDHANDPQEWVKKDRYEQMRHYIYLDKYGYFPYLNLPHSYRAAVARYGRGRIGRDGSLPWQIGEYSLKLTEAFRLQNWDEAKEDAAALGFYVADAHDPLHTTQNYDGQLTHQTGLAERFGIRLIDRYSGFFMLHPTEAAKVDDPTEYAFEIVLEANTWVNRILLADMRSREGLDGYSKDYLDRFYTQIGPTAMQEINAAAHDTGSYWYTAWLNGGKPALPSH